MIVKPGSLKTVIFMQINNKKQHAIYVGERIMADLVVPPVVFDAPVVDTDYVPPLKSPATLNPDNDPAIVGTVDTQDQFRQASGGFTEISEQDGVPVFAFTPTPNPTSTNDGLQGDIETTRAEGDLQSNAYGDWRVRLSLAANANYLYKLAKEGDLLYPLTQTDGVVFPYTPSIQITYAATYDALNIAHTNYKLFQYQNSSIDNITFAADFTAQDTEEANYLLAVIHFLRSVTKMFYGQDNNPNAGVPPPLCFLHGLGTFQFSNHPLVINSFTYALPEDVDYIRASARVSGPPGVSTADQGVKPSGGSADASGSEQRLMQNQSSTKVLPGGIVAPPQFSRPSVATVNEPTYVPTRIKLNFTALPVVSREDISNRFSLRDYATGALLQGKDTGGGIW